MRDRRLSTATTVVALAVSTVLPLLVVLPFGWLWLWEKGFLIHWLIGALLVSLATFTVRMALLRRLTTGGAPGVSEKSPVGAPREASARKAIAAVVERIDTAQLTSRDAVLALGIDTVDAVARQMHPTDNEPVWRFTVPEALLLIERVSSRLRPLVTDNVPLADQLTVGQVLRLYRWRNVIDIAEKGYDIWRLIRVLNPVSAATQEIRERLTKVALDSLREEAAKRLAAAYVREVGEAAIDLYSGRLRLDDAELGAEVTAATRRDRAGELTVAEPLRFLLAGQTSVGKSSLVNALAAEVKAAVDALPATRAFTSYSLSREGMNGGILLTDSPGLQTNADFVPLARRASESDLLVWLVAASRADREIDRAALTAVREFFAARPDRRMPSVLVVLTHIDRLRPMQEWAPPYDVETPGTEKARSIRSAMEAVAADLAVPLADVVPVSLAPDRAAYNVDLVWARIAEDLPAARSAQLLRMISARATGPQWRRVYRQAVGMGRMIVKNFRRGDPAR